jgi:acyl carrier protein
MTTIERVVDLVRDTLGLAPETPVGPAQLLFYDLAFTSLDLLDLLYRVEDQFAVAIPDGTVAGLARGELDEATFANKEHLTPLGRTRLMALLFDSPPEIFPEHIHVQTLPRYCTVAAIARLVDHELAERT